MISERQIQLELCDSLTLPCPQTWLGSLFCWSITDFLMYLEGRAVSHQSGWCGLIGSLFRKFNYRFELWMNAKWNYGRGLSLLLSRLKIQWPSELSLHASLGEAASSLLSMAQLAMVYWRLWLPCTSTSNNGSAIKGTKMFKGNFGSPMPL